MKVCGFSFIKNAIKYDYPIVEAINSVLPVCDAFVIAVGKSEDNTLELIQQINSPKIKIIETTWNEELRVGGAVLAEETNKAFDEIGNEYDWCFYIQGDEILHEKFHTEVRQKMLQFKTNKNVEGLLFNYLHFYGSYTFVGDSRKWYRREVRIIRNDKSIRSWKDAQGFRRREKKLNVKLIDATMYHYGWVKHPNKQQRKQEHFNKYWHSDEIVKRMVEQVEEFDYSKIDSLKKFEDTHPKFIQTRIEQMNWQFTFDPTQKQFSIKDVFLQKIENWLGWRIGEYRNYNLID